MRGFDDPILTAWLGFFHGLTEITTDHNLQPVLGGSGLGIWLGLGLGIGLGLGS